MPTFNFTTGPATLPDVGILSYNGCVFSPLFETQVSGVFIQDASKRTTKEIEYDITVDGYVTLPVGHQDVTQTLATLERLLSVPAGALIYSGHGIKIAVNGASPDKDTTWGPIPQILDIAPMGNGGSAKIKWTVKTRILPRSATGAHAISPVLQFNYDTTVTYDEAGYSQVRVTGVSEIPLTRSTVNSRNVPETADTNRAKWPGILLDTLDLTRFRVTQRTFKLSRDKRTLEFDVTIDELPWMAMTQEISVIRGTYTFRPAKAGVGLCNWLCTLSCTYSVPKNRPRRNAWFSFLALLRLRMRAGNEFGMVPPPGGNQNPGPLARIILGPVLGGLLRPRAQPQNANRKVWLIDFNGSEGLYLDSKTVTFSATWRLITVFSEILLASGLWRKLGDADPPGHAENLWAISMKDISGHTSWLRNEMGPDVIVDFGF